MKKIFITATDTDAGKTHMACALVSALVQNNRKVAVFKPISAGCELINGVLINEDAQRLKSSANCHQVIEEINPIAYQAPIAPHIAAKSENETIEISDINKHYNTVLSNNPDIIITEGAGGWRLPLGNGTLLSEFAKATNQDVILIVNMKLGCLNHAILSYEAIKADGLRCIGWIANCIEEMPYLDENVNYLKEHFSAPMLAKVDNETDVSKIASKINLTTIL